MRLKGLLFVIVPFLILSCGKEAAINDSMDAIAGEYELTQYCIDSKYQILPDGKQYSDLKAEVVKSDGQWFFKCDMPIMRGADDCVYRRVNQQISWSPILDKYVVVGDESSFAKQTGYKEGSTCLYFNTQKNIIGLVLMEEGTIKGWYNWKKK